MPDTPDKSGKPDLGKSFGNASTPTEPPKPTRYIKPVARPVSKQQINDLHKLLSTPHLKAEFTPMGAVTRQVRTERDQKILGEIEAIRNRLELRRDAAKEAFARARDNKTVRRGMKR